MKYALALALLFGCSLASGDSWRAATIAGVASPSGQIVVRVVPGKNLGEVYGYGGEPKGRQATAIFYRFRAGDKYVKYQKISLQNPITPLFFAVSDTGELVTLDNWHNMGLGKAVVIYKATGQVLRSYDLTQIYTEAEIKAIPASVSSIWWRCQTAPSFEPRTSTLELQDVLGNMVEINLKTGSLERQPTSHKDC